MIERPASNEYAPYYETYVSVAPQGDPLEGLVAQGDGLSATLQGLSGEAAGFRYAPDKWSIREVVGHLIDAERVFAYRALRFGRGDQTALPGFDQNEWAASTNADQRSLGDLLREFGAVRAATSTLFTGLPPTAWGAGGVASDNYVTVRALLYIILGHTEHHLRILRERYLAHPDFPG
jgi:hypothetical protein